MKKFTSVKEYIKAMPAAAQPLLKQMRALLKEEVPDAEEVISYNMPGYKLKGMLLWFAGYEKHIGLYPKPAAITHFKRELSGYTCSKGAIQFPLDKPLPEALIRKIIRFRVGEASR